MGGHTETYEHFYDMGFAKGITMCLWVNISFWSWMSSPMKARLLRVVYVYLNALCSRACVLPMQICWVSKVLQLLF